jgi:hypothetical protein
VKSALRRQEATVSTHRASAVADTDTLIVGNGSKYSQQQFKKFTTFNLRSQKIMYAVVNA